MGYLDLVHEVLGAPGSPVTPAVSAAEEHVEEVRGRVEASSTAPSALLDPLLAVLVIELPFLGVGQDLL